MKNVFVKLRLRMPSAIAMESENTATAESVQCRFRTRNCRNITRILLAGDGRKNQPNLRPYREDSNVQQVCRPRKHEGFNIGQPRQQKLLTLLPDGSRFWSPFTDYSQHRLHDAACLVLREGPLLKSRQLEGQICARR